jgi:exodeoxyribonuclease V beta subunit
MSVSIASPAPITGAGGIDLDSHSVIEASAGTGKTHTIEELVVELLRRGRVQSLDEILAVTFTEKAAGELRHRIRSRIRDALAREHSEILKVSLDNFDTASIFTIHGFCHKVLQEYAFENREKFHNELVDDRAVYARALRTVMREQWPRRYGERLRDILRLSNFPDLTADGRSRWESRVIEAALRYQPGAGDVLVPDPGEDLAGRIREMEEACFSGMDELSSLVGTIDEEDACGSELCRRYTNLNIRKGSIPPRVRTLAACLRLVALRRRGELLLADAADFFTGPDVPAGGFGELGTGWKGKSPDFEEKLPRLPEIIARLESLGSLDFAGLRNLLAAAAVRQIKSESSVYKTIHGFISYDDMVNNVCDALASGPGLLKRILQKRYRYAIVDEFQDTDMQQWRIFKSVFLEAESNRLFVIGDPKQAIYGFRGADLNAYYLAREEMIRSHAARYYCLVENWRSSPALIDAFNRIFGCGWFARCGIGYVPSRYPSGKEAYAQPDGGALHVIDCGTCTGAEARFRTAEYIAREIGGMAAGGADFEPGDVAVLVKKWTEADAVEKSLRRAGIRYSYYKKEGLYQSREALELFYLLSSVARPGDAPAAARSLVTRFFNVPLCDLSGYEELEAAHPISVLFERWRALSGVKNWTHLFQSIMEDSGMLFRTGMEDYDRSMINLRSIMQDLLVEAAKRNYGLIEIVDHLGRMRNLDASAHESLNLEKIDLESPGVQIMTIHACKGLQFCTVFIAGGFTQRDISEFWTYHAGARTFDLVRDGEHRELYERELLGEEERLFYVALTRARDRLYVPVFRPTAKSKRSSGMLAEKMTEALEAIRRERYVTWTDYDQASSERLGTHAGPRKKKETLVLPEPLFPDPGMSFLDRRLVVDSFSGLKLQMSRATSSEDTSAEFGDAGPTAGEDDVPPAAGGGRVAGLPMTELPHSRETGLMLHEVLERIDYAAVRDAGSPEELLADDPAPGKIIAAAVQRQPVLAEAENLDFIIHETAKIIWNALHAPLNGSGLVLCNAHEKIHEVEFYYPYSSSGPAGAAGHGFMHGFIDLIAAHNNRYYIVDWKSNFLEEGYAADKLEKNIMEMRYDLQMSIYASAAVRWLKQAVPGFSYRERFGGVLYLYLRGMDARAPGSGVYTYLPEEGALIY